MLTSSFAASRCPLSRPRARIGHSDSDGGAALELPVTPVFGAADRYLNPDLAGQLAGLFRHAELHLVEGASHWPQWDQPGLVARLLTKATPR